MTRRAGWLSPPKGLGEKALSRFCIALGREKEVDRRTGGVDSPVKIHPLALNPEQVKR